MVSGLLRCSYVNCFPDKFKIDSRAKYNVFVKKKEELFVFQRDWKGTRIKPHSSEKWRRSSGSSSCGFHEKLKKGVVYNLNEMKEAGLIVDVNEPTDWVGPKYVVRNLNGEPNPTDPTDLKNMKRQQHLITISYVGVSVSSTS